MYGSPPVPNPVAFRYMRFINLHPDFFMEKGTDPSSMSCGYGAPLPCSLFVSGADERAIEISYTYLSRSPWFRLCYRAHPVHPSHG